MDNDNRKALGQKIREKREQRWLSQTELAQSVNKTSPAYIAFIEAWERNISAMDLMLIAKSLGTTVSELIGEGQKAQPEVMQALRADKELNKKDREKVAEYYSLLKAAKKW